MSKYSKTPFVGARVYCISGPQRRLDDMIQLVESKDQYLYTIDGVIENVYAVNRSGTKKHFLRLQADGTYASNCSTWGRSGWTHVFAAD